MHRILFAFFLFLVGSFFSTLFGATPEPIQEPGIAWEEEAETYERRDEKLAAILAYLRAWEEVIAAAKEGGEDAPWLQARAVFLLEKAYDLNREFAVVPELLSALQRFSDPTSGTSPVDAARATWLRGRLLLRMGRGSEAREGVAPLGFLQEWFLLGPLDPAMEGPRIFDLTRTFPGKVRPVSWCFHTSQDPLGKIDLSAIFRPREDVVAYALALILVEEERRIVLRLGVDDEATVWLNTYEIFREEAERHAEPDQLAIPLSLRKGENVLLLRIRQRAGAWEFFARLTELDGTPVRGVRIETKPEMVADRLSRRLLLPRPPGSPDIFPPLRKPQKQPAPATPSTSPSSQAEGDPETKKEEEGGTGGAIATLAEIVDREEENARAAYYLGSILMFRENLDPRHRHHRQLLLRATRLAPQRGVYYLALARAASQPERVEADRDENLRRIVLDHARGLGEEDAAAAVELGRYYLESMGNLERASMLVNRALQINPQSAGGLWLRGTIDLRWGWVARARRLFTDAARRHPDHIGIRLSEGEMAARDGDWRTACKAFAAAYGIDMTSDSAFRGLVTSLRHLPRGGGGILSPALLPFLSPEDGVASRSPSRVDLLRRLLTSRLESLPYDIEARREGIRHLLRQGEKESALREAEAWLALAPEDGEPYRWRGQCLAAMGRMQEAEAAWEEALQLDSSQRSIREYLAFLRAKESRSRRETKSEEERNPRVGGGEGNLLPFGGEVDALFLSESPPATLVPPGTPFYYLLDELATRVREDGTRCQTYRRWIRILTAEGAQQLRQIAIRIDPETECLTVPRRRVFHKDGYGDEAKVLLSQRRDADGRIVHIVEFPPLLPEDLLELEYSIEEIRPGFFGDAFGEIFLFRRTVPVRLCRYRLTVPSSRTFAFHQTGGAPAPTLQEEKETKTVTRVWEMRDLSALVEEPYMPPRRELSPTAQASSFTNWDDFARRYWRLIESQYLSTPEIRKTVREITQNLDSDEKKVYALLQWVTDNIRYVPWEFGVYGYKPYSAGTIFSRRFGDCKDKTALFIVMLRELDIEAWPVLLWATHPTDRVAGRGREDWTLPLFHHFNHCITWVNLPKRSLYLDPTASPQAERGLPIHNAGAEVVVVTPHGAVRTRISPQSPADNVWEDRMEIDLQREGEAEMRQDITVVGHLSNFLRRYLANPTTREGVIRVFITRAYGPLARWNLEGYGDDIASGKAQLSMHAVIPQLGRLSDEGLSFTFPRIFLRGRLGKDAPLPERLLDFASSSTRIHDLVLPFPFRVDRTITVVWPPGWRLVNDLSSVLLEDPLWLLRADYETVGNSLTLRLRFEIRATRIPRDRYEAFRNFCREADALERRVYLIAR